MLQRVHSARIHLRGDERYNPRFTQEPEYRADGASTVTGLMRPDSPEGVAVKPTLPDLPFRIIVPANAGAPEYIGINTEIWRRIQKGETLWNLDFAPPLQLPPPPQVVARNAGGLFLGAIAFALLMAIAID
jgi:hypothetical protein